MSITQTDLMKKIRSRGSWEFILTPSRMEPDRIPIPDMFQLVSAAAVHLRGWPFPTAEHSLSEVIPFQEYVRCECDRDMYKQTWFLFKSGQFAALTGFREDWRDESRFYPKDETWTLRTKLMIVDTVFNLTEAMFFASRYSETKLKDENITIEVRFNDLENRFLALEPNTGRMMASKPTTGENSFAFAVTKSQAEIKVDAQNIAVDILRRLFECFAWNCADSFLTDVQEELLKGRTP